MDEYQIKLAASKSEVPVNFLVEMILGVPAETLERSRSYYDPNEPWRDRVSLLPGAGKVGFPVGGDEASPGYNEWLVMGAYIFLTQCIALKFDLKESEFMANKISTLEFSQWVKQDEVFERLDSMEVDICEHAISFVEFVLKKLGPNTKKKEAEKSSGGHSRSDPDGNIRSVIRKLKKAKVLQSNVPYHPDLIKVCSGKEDFVDRKATKEEYESIVTKKFSTIKTLVREIYKT
ncbi:MAG: hypothetical protein H8E42_02740 [Nitrospinae bacterium]|nr:hypothetical protein [Nitrospinota bacterium]